MADNRNAAENESISQDEARAQAQANLDRAFQAQQGQQGTDNDIAYQHLDLQKKIAQQTDAYHQALAQNAIAKINNTLGPKAASIFEKTLNDQLKLGIPTMDAMNTAYMAMHLMDHNGQPITPEGAKQMADSNAMLGQPGYPGHPSAPTMPPPSLGTAPPDTLPAPGGPNRIAAGPLPAVPPTSLPVSPMLVPPQSNPIQAPQIQSPQGPLMTGGAMARIGDMNAPPQGAAPLIQNKIDVGNSKIGLQDSQAGLADANRDYVSGQKTALAKQRVLKLINDVTLGNDKNAWQKDVADRNATTRENAQAAQKIFQTGTLAWHNKAVDQTKAHQTKLEQRWNDQDVQNQVRAATNMLPQYNAQLAKNDELIATFKQKADDLQGFFNGPKPTDPTLAMQWDSLHAAAGNGATVKDVKLTDINNHIQSIAARQNSLRPTIDKLSKFVDAAGYQIDANGKPVKGGGLKEPPSFEGDPSLSDTPPKNAKIGDKWDSPDGSQSLVYSGPKLGWIGAGNANFTPSFPKPGNPTNKIVPRKILQPGGTYRSKSGATVTVEP